MKQTATVVRREGKLVAEVERAEACANCRACKFGQSEKVYVDLPADTYAEGDRVELEMDDAQFSRTALLAYGLPAAAFIAGLFAARGLGATEGVQALAALGAVGISLIAIHMIDRRGRKSGTYAQGAHPCRENGGEYGGDHHTQSGRP